METPDVYSPLIFLVDDECHSLEQLDSALGKGNYRTRCCQSAEEVFTALEEVQPDLIISDVMLKDDSGVELCETIKKNPVYGEVPVMFLSAGQTPDIIRRHDALGGTYYLRKPCDPDVLLGLIENALEKQKSLHNDLEADCVGSCS